MLPIWLPSFWDYIFRNNTGWRNILCRLKGHPSGIVFYTSNPEATEPDNRCKDCDEYIA